MPNKKKLSPEDAFGRVIRERRLELGLTQSDLEGNGDGLERSYISRLESGKYQVCLRGILFLARALGMTSAELMRQVEMRLYGPARAGTHGIVAGDGHAKSLADHHQAATSGDGMAKSQIPAKRSKKTSLGRKKGAEL